MISMGKPTPALHWGKLQGGEQQSESHAWALEASQSQPILQV